MQCHTLFFPCLLSWVYSCQGFTESLFGHSRNRKNMPVLRTAQLLLWSVSYWKDLKAGKVSRMVAVRFCCYFWSQSFNPLFQRHTCQLCAATQLPVPILPGPGDPQPTPVAWEKNLQIVKVNTALSRDIVTYRRTMLKEAPAGTKHQSMNWNRTVCYSKR